MLFRGAKAFLFIFVAITAAAAEADDRSNEAIKVLQGRCWSCHSSKVSMAGLQLDSRDGALRGGGRGPSVVPGQSASSRLITAVRKTSEPAMPPTGKLSEDEIAVLARWIDSGAKWPDSAVSTAPSTPTWWAFRKPQRSAVPVVSDAWIKTPVDTFVLAKLRDKQLEPAREADRRTLVRRAYLDLHGLAPTAAQIEKHLADKSPDAYEKLIDELLASPRYGERWGRHWLDLVRYGDTSGFEQDPYMLYAWRYRDYVIESFNSDKPYDRFVKEQIAGDELFPEEPAAQAGTGYYTVGPNRDMLFKVEDVNREDTLADYVDTTASVFLGLTAGCARCHDHKFDPLPQKDYYRLRAIFMPLEKTRVFLDYNPARGYDLNENMRHARLQEIGDQLEALLKPVEKRISDEKLSKLAEPVRTAFKTPEVDRTPEMRALVQENQKAISAPAEEVRAQLTAEQTAQLRKLEIQLVNMFKGFKPGPFAPGVRDISREAPKTFMPARAGQKIGTEVDAGFPTALGGGSTPEPPPDAISTGRRKALAEWIASPDNPLTARVMVNRIWQGHFGKGLVATPSDFGTRGSAPSHPELLDWLATEFVQSGWSMKRLHKLLMTSAVYRQSTQASEKAIAADPSNALLSRFERRRLSPEEIRDSMLLASGGLNLKMFGRPVVPAVAKEELFGLSGNPDGMWIVNADTAEQRRRSVYMLARRTFRPAMFESFDAPDGVRSCSRRESSNTAPQSLTMLNGRWTVDESRRLAASLTSGAADAGSAASAAEMVGKVYLAIYGRGATATELTNGAAYLERQVAELGSLEKAASELARALFNTNEFLYVD